MAALVGSTVVEVAEGTEVEVGVDVAAGVVGGLLVARGLPPLHAATERAATVTASIRRPPCIVQDSGTITDIYATGSSRDLTQPVRAA
jgi:hypothetical protein